MLMQNLPDKKQSVPCIDAQAWFTLTAVGLSLLPAHLDGMILGRTSCLNIDIMILGRITCTRRSCQTGSRCIQSNTMPRCPRIVHQHGNRPEPLA